MPQRLQSWQLQFPLSPHCHGDYPPPPPPSRPWVATIGRNQDWWSSWYKDESEASTKTDHCHQHLLGHVWPELGWLGSWKLLLLQFSCSTYRPLLSRPLLSRPLLSRPLLSRPLLSRLCQCFIQFLSNHHTDHLINWYGVYRIDCDMLPHYQV